MRQALCRCAVGDPHESPALTYREGGRTKTVTLTDAEAGEVAAAPARYSACRAELDRAAEAGLVELHERRAARRGGRR